MTALLLVLLGLLGAAIGSFLNVVIARVPAGESVVSPPSRCPTCGNGIAARDNIPLLSWLLLRGCCRNCGQGIARRYPVVEMLTTLLFVALGARFGLDAALPAYLYLAAVGTALAFIDLDTRRLPNVLVLPSYGVGIALLGAAALLEGERDAFLRALLGMAVMYGLYFALAFAYPAGMGFGDVKLAGVLGLYLGWIGWGVLGVGLFAGFLLGGVVGVALMVAGRAGRKSAIPFGPFMLAGAGLAVFVGQPIADAWFSLGT